MTNLTAAGIILVGRSGSHFTRTARIFADELGVPYEFQIVRDLLATAEGDYGGNPTLRLPVLRTPAGDWFGTLNICRELARRAALTRHVVWPEQLDTPLLANAQELVLQAMATEVELIMSGQRAAPTPHLDKRRASLEASVRWLDDHVSAIVAALPDRDLSFLEVTLFCLIEHLPFRQIMPLAPFQDLTTFATTFAQRPSARRTPFAFDAPLA